MVFKMPEKPGNWPYFRRIVPLNVAQRAGSFGWPTKAQRECAGNRDEGKTSMLASTAGRRWLCVVALLGATVTLSACAANKELEPDSALNGSGKYGAATPGSQRDFTQNVGDIVYFSTDQTDLTPEGTQILAKQAQWLKQYPQYTITIEGHADERGTREYNIALGAKRATSVRNYLSQNGINA